MPNSLLIIGASARAAAESASTAGLRVFAIDQFGDQDTRAAVSSWRHLHSPTQIPKLVHDFPHCDILPVGGFESWQDAFSTASNANLLLAPSPRTVQTIRSLTFLRDVALETSIQFPETHEVLFHRCSNSNNVPMNDSVAASIAAPSNNSSWLLKFPNSSAGLRVFAQPACSQPVSTAKPSTRFLKNDSQTEKAWLQKRVPGKPYGASFLANDSGIHLLGVCRSLTQPSASNPFLYAGSIGPIPVSASIVHKLQQLAKNIVCRTNLRGLFGIDFIFDTMAQQVWLLEVNPRYTASMELLEPGNSNSLVKQHLDAYRTTSSNSAPSATCQTFTPRQRSIKKIVWAKKDVPSINLRNFLSKWKDNPSTQPSLSHISIHDIPSSYDSIAQGTPVLTILSRMPAETLSWFRQYREVLAVERQLYSAPQLKT